MKRTAFLILIVVAVTIGAFAAGKVEKVGPFAGEASEALKSALQSEGYRVYLPNTLVGCEVWFAAKTAEGKNTGQGTSYPDFKESTFLGVITFPKGGGTDFRGQSVRAGSYTMRYEVLPSDGNHLGVAPYPDFVLLTPIADDPDPNATFDFVQLMEKSRAASRTSHPASFEMLPPEKGEPAVTQTDDGWVVLHGTVTTADGKKLPVALVVKGSAT
ncbi:MAG TPA: hypothetical protein VN577_19825 [Terriglobales bacterium]|nr:hypothetical protein [Terriglobales bacterium]